MEKHMVRELKAYVLSSKSYGFRRQKHSFFTAFFEVFWRKNSFFLAQKICLDFQRAKPQWFAKFREISKFGSHSAVGE